MESMLWPRRAILWFRCKVTLLAIPSHTGDLMAQTCYILADEVNVMADTSNSIDVYGNVIGDSVHFAAV